MITVQADREREVRQVLFSLAGSGSLKNDSPLQIVAMEKEAQTSIMHKE